ncbi:hypothetical protein BDW02DRAFT_514350 [Decorospora gaudefroyi]|uniref:glucan 1,4-alpha-glucosidase n=1 Tax=Decorospora gaudefroyi TaxID=184978 RepID=A0A6A5KX86_9PLEO|nr:hypothetical protein BDW02DRAFT_514350 [Decorospora gaudefroyi]
MLFHAVLFTQLLYYTYAFSIPRLPHLRTFAGASHSQTEQQPLHDTTLDAWIEQEEHIALDRLLANIAPGGRNVEGKGVAPGTVIASPSQDEPNYWFQWVRDAAITMNTLVHLYASNTTTTTTTAYLSTLLTTYTTLQHHLQRTPNPSGPFTPNLHSLGEPKFNPNGTPFPHPWGRPQRDGPALRALTLMHYVRALNASNASLWTTDFYTLFYAPELPPRSVIKADLEYVSHFWNRTSFDLWEEVDGLHFFTLMVSARALRLGSRFALAFGDPGAARWYEVQARYAEGLLARFWNEGKGYVVATLWSGGRRSGLDCGVLLGSLHATDADDGEEEGELLFPPWSDQILLTLLSLSRDQASRFPINNRYNPERFQGIALGRYPEDTYNGYTSTSTGNPWFLCTSTAAEILYRAAAHIARTGSLTISEVGVPFYAALLATTPTLHPGTLTAEKDKELLRRIKARLISVGDEFLDTVRRHVDDEGAMSEQFDRGSGFMVGARDLAWSYGSFLGAVRGRRLVGS